MAENEIGLFIDLENITTSLWSNFHQTPDPFAWMEKARTYGAVSFARAYGDFSQPHLNRLEASLHSAGIEKFDCPTKQRYESNQSTVDTNIVIDLFETSLDRPSIGTFMLMAGDSDYIRVVARLRNRLRKRVVISAVPGSVSRDLVRAAGTEDPLEPLVVSDHADDSELIRLVDRFESSRREGVLPVFNTLLRYVSDGRNGEIVPGELAQHRLSELVRSGVLQQRMEALPNGETTRVTRLDRANPQVVEALAAKIN